MFAMTSLVGNPVVAAPKVTRTVRSTKTVAAFGTKKAPAKKAAKKVRTLTYLREHISIPTRRPRRASRGAVANARAGDPSPSSRRGSRVDRAVARRTARAASRRKGGCSDKIASPTPLSSQLAGKPDCRPTRRRARRAGFPFARVFREDEIRAPTDRRVSALFRPRSQGEKKSFGEWLLNAACRDSGAIGAGYEGELKDGRFKGKGKK